ncbi:DNA-directed RNA polymerase subunit L [Candidatus Woesearchaeota archaeon]|nr:DNA-directed RNA polymerase subunit L [Candidatus Woesearchaeota archaeon]
MELNVLEESPKRLVVEVKGANHTLCNAVKAELWNNRHVKVATYSISHPLIGIPKFLVETDGEVKPRKAMADTASKLAETASGLKKEFKKLKG